MPPAGRPVSSSLRKSPLLTGRQEPARDPIVRSLWVGCVLGIDHVRKAGGQPTHDLRKLLLDRSRVRAVSGELVKERGIYAVPFFASVFSRIQNHFTGSGPLKGGSQGGYFLLESVPAYYRCD